MILCDKDIKQALQDGLIEIDPPPRPEQYATSSLDLLLGDEFLRLLTPEELAAQEPPGAQRPLTIDTLAIDIRAFLSRYAKRLELEPDGSFVMQPGIFVLARTRDRIHLPRESQIAARVEGRSTLARLGLVVHMTAPVVHADFEGVIVLEMYNFSQYPLRLWPHRLHICQLVFERLSGTPEVGLSTSHQHQRSVG